jgi:ankyrin repeat protein
MRKAFAFPPPPSSDMNLDFLSRTWASALARDAHAPSNPHTAPSPHTPDKRGSTPANEVVGCIDRVTRLLREADDDLDTALIAAAMIGDVACARLLVLGGAEPNEALCVLAQREAVEPARLLIKAGADPSSALVDEVSRQLESAEPASHTLKVLLFFGADISVALRLAVAEDATVQARALLMLGADGEAALSSVLQNNDAAGARCLINAGMDVTAALQRLAEQGDLVRVRLLIGAQAKATHAFIAVAAGGNVKAAHVLHAAGANATHAYQRLLDRHDVHAVRCLLESGADTSAVLRDCLRTRNHAALELLIAMGADAKTELIAAARHTRWLDMVQLIAAGAHVGVSKGGTKGSPISQRLDRATLEAAALLSRMGNEADDDVISSVFKVSEHLVRLGPAASRALMLRARQPAPSDVFELFTLHLSAGNWHNAKTLFAKPRGEDAAGLLMTLAVKQRDRCGLELILAAGASPEVHFQSALARDDFDLAAMLMHAGMDKAQAFRMLVINGKFDFLGRMVDTGALDDVEALCQMDPDDRAAILKILIPHGADGSGLLCAAYVRGEQTLFSALLATGADRARALVYAIDAGEIATARALIKAGVNLQAALRYAIHADSPSAATLIMLGADPSMALMQAVENGRTHRAARHGGQPALQTPSTGSANQTTTPASAPVTDAPTRAVLESLAKDADGAAVLASLVEAGVYTVDALIDVAKDGDLRLARALIQAGADSVMALMDAVIMQNRQAAAVLIAAGAKPNLVLNATAHRKRRATQAFIADAQREAARVGQRDHGHILG